MIEIEPANMLATTAVVPATAIPLAPRPTFTVCVTMPAAVSMTETVPPAPFVTRRFDPENANPLG
jgi:hypothetical protein